MKDLGWLLVGGAIIALLFVGILVLLRLPKNEVAIKPKTEKLITQLNEDYSNPEAYNELTINDIVDGRLLKSETAIAKPFAGDTLPIRYNLVNQGPAAAWYWDDQVFARIKDNPERAPYRNQYYYKIKYADKWLRIVGQQVKNIDGSSAYLHFVIGFQKEVDDWGGNGYGIQPIAYVPDQFFANLVPREFLSPETDYYKPGGKVEKLLREWQETGIVPEELQKTVLQMSIKW